MPALPAPTAVVSDDLRESRESLMAEEFGELILAMREEDIVDIANGLADLLYVVFGQQSRTEFQLTETSPRFTSRTCQSSALMDDRFIGEHRKRLKGPNYRPPQTEPLLRA